MVVSECEEKKSPRRWRPRATIVHRRHIALAGQSVLVPVIWRERTKRHSCS